MAEDKPWRVVGFDTFAREEYGLGSFATREEAMAAARAQLAIIARNQPRDVAGSLQDDVAVVSPEGESVAIDPA
ncbi:MAG: hypothetical protein GW859_11095 [Sphingomonadales bacterium]|nr:hypothetical protein [Sphingomonadales bacterium]